MDETESEYQTKNAKAKFEKTRQTKKVIKILKSISRIFFGF